MNCRKLQVHLLLWLKRKELRKLHLRFPAILLVTFQHITSFAAPYLEIYFWCCFVAVKKGYKDKENLNCCARNKILLIHLAIWLSSALPASAVTRVIAKDFSVMQFVIFLCGAVSFRFYHSQSTCSFHHSNVERQENHPLSSRWN